MEEEKNLSGDGVGKLGRMSGTKLSTVVLFCRKNSL